MVALDGLHSAVFEGWFMLAQSQVTEREQMRRVGRARIVGMQTARHEEGILEMVIIQIIVDEIS